MDLLPAETRELERCEAVIEGGLQTFVEVGTALMAIRDKRLYRAEHGTFEEYCRERWDMTRQHANRLIQSAEIITNLEPIGSKPEAESQARPLVHLDPPRQREAWSRAVETAPNGKVTAKHVESVVSEMDGRAAVKAEILRDFTPARPLPDQSSFLGEPDEEPEPSIPDPPTDTFADRWLKYWEKINVFLVSIPRRGGLKNLTRDWSVTKRRAAAAHLQLLENAAREGRLEIEETL